MLIATKLQRPRVAHDLLQRQRLFAALAQGSNQKLTLVCAPAGYGKSSLVSSWLEQADRDAVWVSLDRSDSDLGQFLSYLVAGLETARAGSCPNLISILQSSTLPPVDFVTANLINDLNELDGPLIIVLDDFHFIEDDGILELVGNFLQYLPQHIHLVVITREDPHLPLVQMRARHELMDIRTEQLRLTPGEATLLLQQFLGNMLTAADLEVLTVKTEGWPVGLRLAALAIQDSASESGVSFRADTIGAGHVMDYLIAEVLTHTEPSMRAFMLQTSLCNRLCADLCCVLLNKVDSARTIDDLVASLKRTNLFVVELDDRGIWWRYHHLFQELLQHQLHIQYSQSEVHELHRNAASWYAEHGYLDEAMTHLLVIEDFASAAILIEQNRYALMNVDRWHAIERWLSRLPQGIKRARPDLILAQAWVAYYRHRLAAIPDILAPIGALLVGAPTENVVRAEVEFFQALGLFWMGKSDQVQTMLGDVLAQLPAEADQVRGEVNIYSMLALQLTGRKQTAIQTLYQDMYGPVTPSPIRKTRLLGALAFLHLLEGELDAMFEVSAHALDIARSVNNAYVEAWMQFMRAFYYYARNELDAAEQAFKHAVAQRYVLHTRAAVDSMAGLAMTYAAQGKLAEAQATLEMLHKFATANDELVYVTIARTAQARVMLQQGQIDAARQRLQTTPLETDIGILFFFFEIPRITACRVRLVTDADTDLRECVTMLEELHTLATRNHNVRQLIDINILRALAYRRLELGVQAQDALDAALNLAASNQWIRPFIEGGPEMAHFLREQSTRHAQHTFVASLLAAFPPSAKWAAPNAPSHVPESLTDRESEILQLLAQRLSNQEIATELVVSVATVKRHTANIYQKLDVNSRRHAVAKARAIGQLPPVQ